MQTNVMVIRVVTGEEVVAKVVETDTSFILKKPAQIVMQGDPQTGRAQMGLVDYVPMSDDKSLIIAKDKILFKYKPISDVENAYNKMFGSGLVMPEKKSLLTI